jgi:hypothetical protein
MLKPSVLGLRSDPYSPVKPEGSIDVSLNMGLLLRAVGSKEPRLLAV